MLFCMALEEVRDICHALGAQLMIIPTILMPLKRTTTLLKFAQRLNGTKAIKEDFAGWHLKFSDALVQFRARVLPQETIRGGSSSKATYKEEDADWNRAFKKWNCFSATKCT